jgi:chemotaxis family two-component system response regulator Rcp1
MNYEHTRPMEILMIEDSQSDARLAMQALTDGNVKYDLTLVEDGNDALLFLFRHGPFAHAPRPDLILLDLNLPGLDGRDVLQGIKKDLSLSTIPVVVMTASELHEDRVRSEILRVDGYMVKPLDMAKFVAIVRQLSDYWDSDVMLPALATTGA